MPDELNLMNLAFLALVGVVAVKFPKLAAKLKEWWGSIPKPQTTVQVPPVSAPVDVPSPPTVVTSAHPVKEAVSKLMVDLAAKEKAAVESLRAEAAAKVAAAGG